jgi:hypothetical protein
MVPHIDIAPAVMAVVFENAVMATATTLQQTFT